MVSTASKRRPSEPLTDARVLIVEARYYDDLADELLAGAEAAIEDADAEFEVVTVPGALEIPAALLIVWEAALQAGRPFHAAVALGCVIRGETGHYDIVAGESARALMDLSVQHRIPLGNGILTVNTKEQAWERANTLDLDKGRGAAEAALAVLRLKRRGLGPT